MSKEEQYFMTIPKDMVKAKGWKKGQVLALAWNDRGNIEVHEAKT